MWIKLELYIISLFLLFFLLFISKVPYCFSPNSTFVGWENLFHKYLLVTLSAICMVLALIFYVRFNYRFGKGASLLPAKIIEIENVNYESVTFLVVYIVPLICMDLDKERNPLILMLILFFIGWIYVKTNLFYTNPTLVIWGYQIYKISTADKKNIIVVTRQKIKAGEFIFLKNIDDNIYLGKIK